MTDIITAFARHRRSKEELMQAVAAFYPIGQRVEYKQGDKWSVGIVDGHPNVIDPTRLKIKHPTTGQPSWIYAHPEHCVKAEAL